MENKVINNNQLDEHIKRIISKSNYRINEANYSLIDNIDEDDDFEDMDGQMPDQEVSPEQESDEEISAEQPPMDNQDTQMPQQEPVGVKEPRSTDEVQNDIIKLQISAMKKMQDVIDNLEATVEKLNLNYEELNKDVEEVREPTNVEKLTSKKQDSHPFGYNMNDLWKNGSFQARIDKINDENPAIIKLDDDTYVGDFNRLSKQLSSNELNNSFRNY